MIRLITIIFLFALLKLNSTAQIGNYISNGSFEEWSGCTQPNLLYKMKYWGAVDSLSQTGSQFSYCNGLVPNQNFTIYQLPRTGKAFLGSTFFIANSTSSRWYMKNRLYTKLTSGHTYCVKFYVNIMGNSPYGNDGFGIYFGDSSIDTITKCNTPLSYLIPQIKCPTGIPIIDTLGWTPITGTFVATGDEKYAIIGIFANDNNIFSVVTNSLSDTTFKGTDACIDDVSCIELNLKAFAGNDTTIYFGDSLFIGRQPDFAIDEGCIWYKYPNMSSAIDTISGLWIKPIVTSTYVVRQELDCSPLKWDTVVVTVNSKLVGLEKLNILNEAITLFPSPANEMLEIKIMNIDLFKEFNEIVIYNNFGQIVQNEELIFKDKSFKINVANLNEGNYILKILSSNYESLNKRFVISR